MSYIERPYTVELIDRSSGQTLATDISKYVVEIDKVEDVGTGEIATSQLMINTIDGQFITEENNSTTPIIDQFDEIRITVTADDGSTFSRIFVVDEILLQQAELGQETHLELYAREYWLKKMKISGHFYFIRYIDMVKHIIDFYNEHRGTSQPEILYDTDFEIPEYPVGIFDFGNGTNCYDAIMTVIARLGLSVSGGGAGDFFELLFAEHPTDESKIRCRIFPLGSKPVAPVTLQGKDVETHMITETKQAIDSTIIVARGQNDTGTLPPNISEYRSMEEEFENFPDFDSTIVYAEDAYVKHGGKVYQSNQNTEAGDTPSASSTEWDEVTFADYAGSTFKYSPYTYNKASAYRSFASNPSNSLDTNFNSPAFPDSNLVVKDGRNYRNFAHFRVKNLGSIPVQYLYPSTISNTSVTSRLPEGTRILVDTSLSGSTSTELSGNDSFGNARANSLVQLRNGKWIVLHEAEKDDEIAVLSEGIVYLYHATWTAPVVASEFLGDNSPDSGLAWRSMQTSYLGLDCFHYPDTIQNTSGLINRRDRNTSGGKYTDNSAVRIRYSFGRNDDIISSLSLILNILALPLNIATAIANFYVTREAYNYGWWATLFSVPFPRSTHNSAGNVGSIFGGTADNPVPVLDLNNLNYLPDGTTGYGQDESDGLNPLTGIHFLFKFNMSAGTVTSVPAGNLPFRVTIYDTEDNVWTQDFTYRFLGETQQVLLPFAGFRIYRARNPVSLAIDDSIHNILTPELKILEIFERRKVSMITLQWQEGYDEAGRYNPATASRVVTAMLAALTADSVQFTGTVDGFCFVRAPTAISKDATSFAKHHIMTDIREYPTVSNVEQLKKIANAELDLAQFRKDMFTVKTAGDVNVGAGESVYLNDEDITSESDDGSNTKKLAVKKVLYTVSAGNNEGGFIRTLTLKDRINL